MVHVHVRLADCNLVSVTTAWSLTHHAEPSLSWVTLNLLDPKERVYTVSQLSQKFCFFCPGPADFGTFATMLIKSVGHEHDVLFTSPKLVAFDPFYPGKRGRTEFNLPWIMLRESA